jgi:hypothetical protein
VIFLPTGSRDLHKCMHLLFPESSSTGLDLALAICFTLSHKPRKSPSPPGSGRRATAVPSLNDHRAGQRLLGVIVHTLRFVVSLCSASFLSPSLDHCSLLLQHHTSSFGVLCLLSPVLAGSVKNSGLPISTSTDALRQHNLHPALHRSSTRSNT